MDDLIIKEREFREQLIQLINNCGLPAVVIKPSIKELFEQLSLLEQQQYEKALKTKKEIKEMKGEKKDDI